MSSPRNPSTPPTRSLDPPRDQRTPGEPSGSSESPFCEMVNHLPQVVWMTTADFQKTILVNSMYAKVWGEDSESLYRDPRSFLLAVHPEDRQRVDDAVEKLREGVILDEGFRLVRVDGVSRRVRLRGFPILDQQGLVRRLAWVAEDVTEWKELEEQFLQAQKMEAVGKLAGGVAHDFNNLLTGILGYTEIFLSNETDPEKRTDIETIRTLGKRAASLTQQLLAFSRRQALAPTVINLNDLIENLTKLLRRLIGEDVDLEFQLDPKLWKVRVDPAQLEQVIVNIVVNARDAMPDGGSLTIETENVYLEDHFVQSHVDLEIGEYVLLTINDDGVGMTEKVKAHIFEPFFTTKEVGKGTGLGLSTVYGIIKQHGGHMIVHSEPDQGSTFEIYLKRVEQGGVETKESRDAAVPPLGKGVILLVEDEQSLLDLVQRVLMSHGYTVHAASKPADATRLFFEHQEEIDLLLTDVVMPGQNGRKLFEQFSAVKPNLKVLYMSGYAEDTIVHHGVLDPGSEFIHKPFQPNALLWKVHDVFEKQKAI